MLISSRSALNVFSGDVPWLRRSLEFWAWPHSARLQNAPDLFSGSLFWLLDHSHHHGRLAMAYAWFRCQSLPASRSAKRPKPIAPEVLIEQRTGGKAENDARPYQHSAPLER